MSSEGAEKEVAQTDKPITSSAVFSMFGGGAKKEKKEEDEDRGDVSGSNKAQREAAAAAKTDAEAGGDDDDQPPESEDVHFEPVVRLTKKVEVETHEEAEDEVFKARARLFRFDEEANAWKERGTGDVRFLKHRELNKVRVVMRRDKTLKVCANHNIDKDMDLVIHKTSDRTWCYTAKNDSSENPEGEVLKLAIRFGNTDIAEQFKTAFLKVQAELPETPKAKKDEEEETPAADAKPAEAAEATA